MAFEQSNRSTSVKMPDRDIAAASAFSITRALQNFSSPADAVQGVAGARAIMPMPQARQADEDPTKTRLDDCRPGSAREWVRISNRENKAAQRGRRHGGEGR
ncbi:hypothetical protein [Sphingomonas palmae]|uniref:hypothetical protein n=1 Tax=Sphingomonas palmae TaxID=1855283 RepID=UPI00115FB7E9|nr:hypothetical protein [Sphingomonas palmae]